MTALFATSGVQIYQFPAAINTAFEKFYFYECYKGQE